MFKGTNKLWKGLALLLVLCMLPTVSLAEEPETNEPAASGPAIITIVGEEEEKITVAEDGVVSVTAQTSAVTEDLTIVAFRAASASATMPETADGLIAKMVYVDQAASDADGKHTFMFKERAIAETGLNWLHVYVGGAGMATVATAVKSLAPAGPVFTKPNAWYTGQPLTLTSTEDLSTWTEDNLVVKVFVEGETEPITLEAANYSLASENKAIQIESAAITGRTIEKIEFTSDNRQKVVVAWENGLTEVTPPAGTLTATPTVAFGALRDITLSATADSVVEGWSAALSAAEYHYVAVDEEANPAEITEGWEGLDVSEGVCTLALEEGEEKAIYYIKATVTGYEPAYVGPITLELGTPGALTASEYSAIGDDITVTLSAGEGGDTLADGTTWATALIGATYYAVAVDDAEANPAEITGGWAELTATDGAYTLLRGDVDEKIYFIKAEADGFKPAYTDSISIVSARSVDLPALMDALNVEISYGAGATEQYTELNAAEQEEYYQDIPADGLERDAFLEATFDEQKEQYGKAQILGLPTEGTNGTTYTWKISIDDGEETDIPEYIERGTETKNVDLLLYVDDDDEPYKTYDLLVSALGATGMDVTVTLEGAIAKDAKLTLLAAGEGGEDIELIKTGADFEFGGNQTVTFITKNKVPEAGTYTLKIERLGYVTIEKSVEIDSEDVAVVLEASDIVFGDFDNDGDVDAEDADAFIAAEVLETEVVEGTEQYDYNGDGKITLEDYVRLCQSVGSVDPAVEAETAEAAFEVADDKIFASSEAFTVDVKLTAEEVDAIVGAKLAFTYDSTVIAPAEELISELPEGYDYVASISDEGDAQTLTLTLYATDADATAWAGIELTEDAILSLNFVPQGAGEAALTWEAGSYAYAGSEGNALVAVTGTDGSVTINADPDAPTVEGLTVENVKAKADAAITYTFNDNSEDTEDAEGDSLIVVLVDGKEVEVEITEDKTFRVSSDWICKDLTVKVKAVADRDVNAVGEWQESDPAVFVMPADDYEPTVTATIGKITVEKETAVGYTFTALDEENLTKEYEWYVLPGTYTTVNAALEAFSLVEEPEVVAEGENTTFAKEHAGKWAILKVTATELVNGEPYDAEKYFAAKITGTSNGSSVQAGANLATGTNVSFKPVDPVVKPEDEKPAEGTSDPSGEAITNGAAAFTDISKETYAWAYDSIDALAKTGVIKGMTANSFGPELSTTNAQVVALVVRVAGLKADGATTEHVDKEHWVYKEMAAAQAAGILDVLGSDVNTEAATTREAAFTLLYKALKAAGITLPEVAEDIAYTDAASISEASKEAISALTKAGIINGMGDGTLAPKAQITRAQLAKILGLVPTK